MTADRILVCTACRRKNRVAAGRPAAAARCGSCGAPLLPGEVAAIDAATHDAATAADAVPLIVDYWAPWCGPCRMMAPEFAKAAAALAGEVRFAKINTEEHPDVAARLGIRGIPLLILWQDGREVARLPGARPASEIVAFARQNARRAA